MRPPPIQLAGSAPVLAGLLAGLLTGCVTTSREPPLPRPEVRGGRPVDPERARSVIAPDPALDDRLAGVAREAAGDWAGARAAYADAAAESPGDDVAVLGLARALHADGLAGEAADLLDHALRRGAESVALLEAAGDAHLAAGRPDRALAHYRRAADLAPDRKRSRLAVVTALMLAGRHEEACDALALWTPSMLPAPMLLAAGRSALLARRPQRAVAWIEAHLERVWEDAAAWTDLGRAHLLRDDPAAAVRALDTALHLGAGRADALALRGHAHLARESWAAARRDYADALRSGADPDALAPLVRWLAARGGQGTGRAPTAEEAP